MSSSLSAVGGPGDADAGRSVLPAPGENFEKVLDMGRDYGTSYQLAKRVPCLDRDLARNWTDPRKDRRMSAPGFKSE